VRVNRICAGWIDTHFNDPIWELLGGREREGELLARGHALVVDGGMMAV
jgi:hypothetical protein